MSCMRVRVCVHACVCAQFFFVVDAASSVFLLIIRLLYSSSDMAVVAISQCWVTCCCYHQCIVMMIPVEYVAVVISVCCCCCCYRYYSRWLMLIMLVCVFHRPIPPFINSSCEFIHYRRIRTSYWSFNKSIIKFIKWKEKLTVSCVCVCASVTHPPPFALFSRTSHEPHSVSLSNASQFRFLSNDWISVCSYLLPLNIDYTQTHTHAHTCESGCVRITWTHLHSIDEVDPLLIRLTHPSKLTHSQRPHHTTCPLIRPTFIFISWMCHRICHHHQHQHQHHTLHYCACVCVCVGWKKRRRACGFVDELSFVLFGNIDNETVKRCAKMGLTHFEYVECMWITKHTHTHTSIRSFHIQSAYMHKMPRSTNFHVIKLNYLYTQKQCFWW